MPATAKKRRNNIVPMRTKKVEPTFYSSDDVMMLMGVGKRKAQYVIKELREELDGKGFHLPPRGKISRRYFHERYGD